MRRFFGGLVGILFIAVQTVTLPCVNATDWPTWRADAQRSAATSEELADQLHLQWTLELPPLKPAWPEDPRLHFDASYEPVVAGTTLYYGSSRNDSVTAVDLVTGEERWRFFTDGPVRFAPLVFDGRVYFGADDGCLYCLAADSGDLVWRFDAAPNNRRVIGNERLISVWPVRGGPVLVDDRIHFTAGVWPFEGTFLHAVDAVTGQLVESKPANAVPHHDVVTLNDMTPQGYLAASDARLFIPQGRSIVGCQDRQSGAFDSFRYSTSGVTNYHVCTTGQWLFHGTVTFDTTGKRQLGMSLRTPVLGKDMIYAGEKGKIVAFDLTNPQEVERIDRRGKTLKVTLLTESWSLANNQIREVPTTDSDNWLVANPLIVDLKAGNRLYGHQGKLLFAIDLPTADKPAAVSWKTEVNGTPSSMLAANGRLVVVTAEGGMHCFGAASVAPRSISEPEKEIDGSANWSERVAALLKQADPGDSYCVALGISSGGLISELVRQSKMRIIVLSP